MEFRTKRKIALIDLANCYHSSRAIRTVAESYGFTVELYDRWVEEDLVEDLKTMQESELIIFNSHGEPEKGLIAHVDVDSEYANLSSNKNYYHEKRDYENLELYTFYAGHKFFEQHKNLFTVPTVFTGCDAKEFAKTNECTVGVGAVAAIDGNASLAYCLSVIYELSTGTTFTEAHKAAKKINSETNLMELL